MTHLWISGGRFVGCCGRRHPGIATTLLVAIALLVELPVGSAAASRSANHDNNGLPAITESNLSQAHTDSDLRAFTDSDLRALTDRLFASIDPSLVENQYFPPFAKDKVRWVSTEQRAGRLSIIFLVNLEGTNLTAADLMASGRIRGQPTLIIAKPRFMRFVEEEVERVSGPFSARAKNDFLLGVIHEAVHLQNPDASDQARSRTVEESRTWRDVNVNVVRDLRQANQPMHSRFIAADNALTECLDQLPCQQLLPVIFPR